MRAFFAGALLIASLACSGRKEPAKDSLAATAGPVVATPGVAAPDCPRTGHWSACQVRKRLEQAGLAPRDTSALSDVPQLGTKPSALMLGNAGLAYYLFADTVARHKAAATLDTLRFIPQSQSLTMRNEVTRIESDNMLALLYSRNEHQRERVADAITAGPPQP